MAHSLTLEVLPDLLAVVRLPPRALLSPALQRLLQAGGALASVTYTTQETSLLLPDTPPLAAALPPCAVVEPSWRALRVKGPLPFDLVGVLASLLTPLAAAAIPIFSLSTFNTDYVLVKAGALQGAVAALQARGHAVLQPQEGAAVRQATAAELPLIRARWHEAWGDGRTLPELLAEEAHLDAHPFSTSGARRHYVLAAAPGSPPPAAGAAGGAAAAATATAGEEAAQADFFCSCEVLLTPHTAGGEAWHIACLFTPQQHRGRGHASALLRGLRTLAGGSAPLLLYSDIGPSLYRGLGFAVPAGRHAVEDLVLPAAACSSAAGSSGSGAAAARMEDLPLHTDLSQLRLPPPPPLAPGACALVLTPQRLAWLCEGEAWRQAQLQGPPLRLPARGALLPGSAPGELPVGLCVWVCDAARGDLVVVLLRAGTPSAICALLQRARSAAREAGLHRVRVWDTADQQVAQAVGTLVAWRERRVGKLPMVAAGEGSDLTAATWVLQDRGAWY
jgi:hypothetical protein